MNISDKYVEHIQIYSAYGSPQKHQNDDFFQHLEHLLYVFDSED